MLPDQFKLSDLCKLPDLFKPERPPFTDSGWLNAMTVVAVAMFIGHWMIGPAIESSASHRVPLRSATLQRQALDQALQRPDPSPYRTPTPAFANKAPRYAAAAKQKAQAFLALRDAEEAAMQELASRYPATLYPALLDPALLDPAIADASGAPGDPEAALQPSRAWTYGSRTGLRD